MGEEHNNADVDLFIGALYATLTETFGFRHAAVETTEILAAAEPYETTRFGRGTHLLATQPLPPAFDHLRELYRAIPGSEAAWLIDQLLLSRSVFVRNALNDGWLGSNRDREQNMKTLFSFKYREALAAGENLPKVLWKAGHVHASRKYQRTGVFPTGSFLAELATFNGGRYYNVAVLLHTYADPKVDASVAYLAPLQAAGRADGWTYVDLAQVLRWWAGSPESVDPQLRDLFEGFDAALVFPKPRPVARTVVPA